MSRQLIVHILNCILQIKALVNFVVHSIHFCIKFREFVWNREIMIFFRLIPTTSTTWTNSLCLYNLRNTSRPFSYGYRAASVLWVGMVGKSICPPTLLVLETFCGRLKTSWTTIKICHFKSKNNEFETMLHNKKMSDHLFLSRRSRSL